MHSFLFSTGAPGFVKAYFKVTLLVLIASILILTSARAQRPKEVRITPALQSKLDALKARGLDYSGALVFWPLGDGEGLFSQAFGTLNPANPDALSTAALDVHWVKQSRLKGQSCLEFAPPDSTVNGGGRNVLPVSLKAFTIEGWCRPAWLRGGGMIFHQGWAVDDIGLYVNAHNAEGSARLNIRQHGSMESIASPVQTLPGGWMHVACTYDGASRKAVVLVNGKRVAEKILPWEGLGLSGPGWRIGGSDPQSGMGGQFNGLIDEVVVWDRPLNDDEVARHYELGKPDPGTEIVPVLRPAPLELKKTGLPALGDVVAHFDFENSLKPGIAGRETAAQYQAKFIRDSPAKNGPLTVKPGEPRYREGKFGKGLYLGSKGAETSKGEALNLKLSRLPEAEGSIAFWFKPDWEWGKGDHILYRGAYRMNTASVTDGSVVTEAGQGEQGELGGPVLQARSLKDIDRKPGAWHFIVSSWYRDGTSRVFLDGVDSGPVYTPLRDFGRDLILGSDNLAGTDRDTGDRRPDAVIDELTILNVGLAPAQVEALYRAKKPLPDSIDGIFYSGTRTVFRRGEKMKLSFRCLGGVSGSFSAIIRQGKSSWPLGKGTVKRDFAVACDTQDLRPGTYDVVVSVRSSPKMPARSAKVNVMVRQDDEPPMPFTALAFLRDEQDEDRLAEAGIDNLRSVINDMATLDRVYRKGLHYSPSLMTADIGPELTARGIAPQEWSQLYWRPDGKHQWVPEFGPSPFSPIGQQAKYDLLHRMIGWCKDHPAVRYVNLYDEYGIRLDISPAARAYFKQQTGLTALPDFKLRASGIWPDNDPYVRWIDTFGVDYWANANLGMEDRVMTQELHRFSPGLKTFSTPSSGMGEIDFESVEIYPYLLEGPLARGVRDRSNELRADTQMDLYNAFQSVRPRKPQWPLLGWFNIPGQPEANESLQVLMEVCLAKGAQGFLIAPDTWVRNRPDMIQSVRRLSDLTDKYGPLLKSLQYYGTGTVAVLVNDYGVMSSGDAGNPRSRSDAGTANIVTVLRAAGVPVEVISPQQVLEGRLDSCEALVLAGYIQTTRSLHDKILAFEARGGLIFHDDISWDYSSPRGALVPKSSLRLPWDSNNDLVAGDIERLRPLVAAQITSKLKSVPVQSDESFLVPYRAAGTDCQVYFVVNRDLFADHEGVISAAGGKGVVYDLLTGTVVPTTSSKGRLTWASSVKKGGWQIFVRRTAPVASESVVVASSGASITYRIETRNAAGKIAGQVPVQVELRDPQGKETPYGQYVATDAKGAAVGTFRLAALNDTPGVWTISIRNLLMGRVAQTKVAWKAPK